MQHAANVLIWLILFASVGAWRDAVGDATDRYVTRRGDTLWEIAGRYVQDDTVSTHRMMMALFDANPGAFIHNDINHLKIGYALRIPTREALGLPLASPETGDERGMAAATAPPATATRPEPPLEETASKATEAGSDVDTEDMARLQSELALTQEQATRRHAENEALRAQVAALEGRLMALDDGITEPHEAAVERQPGPSPPRSRAPTPTQSAADRGAPEVTRPGSASRMPAWLTISTVLTILGIVVILGFAVIWWRGRRAHDSGPARAQPASLDTEVAADAAGADLMIDLDDLELEPVQGGAGSNPGVPNTASISPKADAASPSKAC